MLKLLRNLLVSFVLAVSSLTAAYVSPPVAYTQEQEIAYVGSRNSNKYHYPSCRWARKIKSTNLITFSSKDDAGNKGYIPCKVCKP